MSFCARAGDIVLADKAVGGCKTCKHELPCQKNILKGKRTVLFGELLKMMDYPDMKIAEEMEKGFPLCGWLPTSGIFPSRIRPPEISEVFLRQMARSFAARTVAATKGSGDHKMDDKLWALTLEEVQDVFLSGPFDESELPKNGIVSPRFGLQQKSKLRPIDNFSASHVNGATGLQEKFHVDSIDEICGSLYGTRRVADQCSRWNQCPLGLRLRLVLWKFSGRFGLELIFR